MMTSFLEILTSEISQRLGWSLLHFVWEGLAIGLIAWLGLLALRRRDSESRYRYLVLAFAALALAPVVTLFVVDPVAATSKEVEVASPTIASVPAEVVDAREALPPLPDIISGDVAPKEVQTTPPKTDVSVTQSNLQLTPGPSGLQPVVDAPKPSVIPINWTTHLSRSLPWCVAIWLGGVGLLVVRLIFQWVQLRRMATQYVRPLESRWQVLTSHMLDAFEIGRAVQFVESQLADVPCVIGWLKPVVLVPTAVMTNLTPTEVEALLIHELVHIKRRDDVINLAQTVVETLLFYHPVVWWISAQIRAERENCCDDVASALIGDRLAYSRALVAAAEVATRTRPPKVALAATGGELTSRIRRLLGLDGNSPPQIHWTAPLIAVVTLALMTGLIACAPAVDKDNATTQAKVAPVESFVESDELLTSIRGVVRDINGKPLSGVRILLHESPVVYPSPNPGETFDIAQTATNTDGRFEFKSVPIQADVYWADRTRMFDVIALPDAKSGLAMTWQRVPDKSDVTLTLKQGKTIAGTVTNLDGEPVAGATLQLRHLMSVRHITQADLEDGRWPRMDDPKYLSLQNSEHAPLVTSDNNGTFRLTNLPENAGLMLDVLHDEHVPALAYAATVKELDAISQQRLKRPVQAGKLDVQLDPGHDVTIHVVYEDTGEPAKGAHRFRAPAGRRNQQSFQNWEKRIDESVDDGTFRLKAVKGGKFHFQVLGPTNDSFPPKYEPGELNAELTPDQRSHEFTVMLPVSNLVPLTVNVVREDSAEPVVGTDIIYREVSITPGSFTVFRIEQNGSQTVLVRPGTTYRFFVRDAGRGRMQMQEFTPEEKTPGELTFKVTPDPVYRGVAVNVEGQPVSGVSIYYRVRVGEHGIRSQRATTNENGEFELKGLFAEIFFEHDQPIDEPTSTLFYHADTHTGAIVDLPLPNGEQPESITVQLKKTEVVTGQLLEADSGMPVAGAKVQLTRLNQTPRAGFFQPIGEPIETDESGMFHVQGGFVGESHDLFITKENFTLKSRADFEIKEPGEFDLGMMELEPTKPRPPVWQVKVPDVSSMERDVALTTLMRAFEASENEFKGKKVKDGKAKFRTPGDGVWQFSRHIWPLVEQDPTSEPSFAASLWLIKHWGFAYAHDKRHGEVRRQAAKLVYEHFIERPELADVATSIVQAGFAKSTGRNMTPLEMGEILVAKNSHPAVRAAALYEVARWLLDTQGGSRTVMSEHKAAAAPLLQSVIDDFPDEEIYEGETYANRCREMLAEIQTQRRSAAQPSSDENPKWNVTLRATDAKTGAALPNAEFEVQLGKEKKSYAADANAEFRAEFDTRTPTYCYLNCSAPGYVAERGFWGNRGSIDPKDTLPEALTFTLEKAVEVGGVVQTASGEPVEGADVLLSLGAHPHGEGARLQQIGGGTFKTDANGRWVCSNAPAKIESSSIRIDHPDFAPMGSNWSVNEHLASLQAGNLTCYVAEPRALWGKVVDEEEKPIHDATLVLGYFPNGDVTTFKTNENGEYEIPRSLDSHLTVLKPGYAPASHIWKEVRGRSPFAPAAARPHEEVNFTLTKGVPVEVRLVDEEGEPINDARVIVDEWETDPTVQASRVLLTMREGFIPETVNDDGVWRWNTAPDGDSINLDIHAKGYMPLRHFPVKLENGAIRVELQLKRPFILSGTVIDSETKRPIDYFKVEEGFIVGPNFNGADENGIWWTNPMRGRDGKFEFTITSTPTRDHGFAYRAIAEGYESDETEEIPFEPGQKEVHFKLRRIPLAQTAVQAPVQQQVDATEWTPKQLLDGINSSMAQYKTIDIRYEVREQRNTNAFGKGDEIIVEGNSSYLFRTDGNRWKADEKSFTYRSGTTELRPTAQTIGFDGNSHYALERGELVLGQETSGDRRHHPATLFWRIGRLRSWLTKALEVPEARVIAYEEVDGHRCVRVESQWAFNDNGAVVKFNLLVSPHQGFLPIQAVIDVDGKDGTHWQLSGLTQDQDSGLWYPTGIHETHDLALPVKRKLYIVTHFSAKPNFTEDDFQIKHPGAVDIVDYRSGDVYFNDVWYPELKKFMREKFNQPPLWLEPTDHLISYADVAVNRKPAPELQAATWLPADPGRWKREGRKWTVLHFFGGGLYQPTPEQICGLKAFRDKYKELGVDVIGVVPHDQVDNAKRTIDTLQIDFPVAVSAPSDAKGYGQIYADFQLKTYGGTFLVDPEGIIHFINNQEAGGDSALTLEQALIKRMGLDKGAYERQETGFAIQDWRTILREWRRLRNSTPATLTLRGKMISPAKELANFGGVTIVAVPHLSVVHGHITAGHTVQDDNQDGVTVTCNPDGTFSIPGLRKATYKLKISGPGISSTERFANVQEGEVGEEFEIRLE
ncbi:MAG: M56 family metallopeptidase [Planctomycetaceae bacterium]